MSLIWEFTPDTKPRGRSILDKTFQIWSSDEKSLSLSLTVLSSSEDPLLHRQEPWTVTPSLTLPELPSIFLPNTSKSGSKVVR